MANGQNLSASQQSTLGLYSAQARAATQRSADLFRLGKTAKVEELALEDAVRELERLAKKATENAQRRARRSGIGRIVGAVAGTIVGAATKSPAAARAAMTAVGGLIGGAAGGGKRTKSKVPSNLVPGGIFYAKDKEELQTKIRDFKDAVRDINKEFNINLGKNFLMDFISGKAFAEAGAFVPEGSQLSLDQMYQAGNITFKEYMGDSIRYFMPGGEKAINTRHSNVTTDEEFAKVVGANIKLDVPGLEEFRKLSEGIQPTPGLDMSQLEKGLFFGDPKTALPGGEHYIGPVMSRENLLESILKEKVSVGEGLYVNPYSELSKEGQKALLEELTAKYRIDVDPTTVTRPLSIGEIEKYLMENMNISNNAYDQMLRELGIGQNTLSGAVQSGAVQSGTDAEVISSGIEAVAGTGIESVFEPYQLDAFKKLNVPEELWSELAFNYNPNTLGSDSLNVSFEDYIKKYLSNQSQEESDFISPVQGGTNYNSLSGIGFNNYANTI